MFVAHVGGFMTQKSVTLIQASPLEQHLTISRTIGPAHYAESAKICLKKCNFFISPDRKKQQFPKYWTAFFSFVE
jgi:hypothetical protein